MNFFSKCARVFRENATIFLGTGSAVVIAASMLPEVLFLPKLRNMTNYQDKNGEEKKIDSTTQSIIEKVLLRILLRPEEEATMKFYVSSLSDPVHYGSTKTIMGAVVGLPVSFQYDKSLDLSSENFYFSGIRLTFDGSSSNSEAAKQLAESFAISNNAKAFVIAREVYNSSSYRLHIETALRSSVVLGITNSCYFLNKKVARPLKLWAQLSCFAGFCVLWGSLYLVLHDAHRCWLDSAADRRAAKLGRSLAEGGVEYYNSVLKRNQALRVLTPSGRSHFTQFGNEVSSLRQKSLQKTTRRENLVKLLESYNTKGSEDNLKEGGTENLTSET